MTRNVSESTRSRSRLPYCGPKLWAALAALVVGTSALAVLTMPDPMTIHWRIGLDGTVTERTASRWVATIPFALAAVLTFGVALAVARIRDSSPEVAAVYDLVATAVLVLLAAVQALLLALNALLA